MADDRLMGRLCTVAFALALAVTASASSGDLTELSLEELMNVEVTLPSRRPESRALASSAVYVITQEDIRRAGVTTIPDALRLAPGVQVARQTANTWAIGVRGFASSLTRSVLVLMDGRSVYTPLFAGTYWNVQDTAMDDIERIEVIRGPGGTLWGANAVNGVINIVTKSAKDTQGALVSGGGGSEERGFGTVRYGGKLGKNLFYRLYGKYFYRSAYLARGVKDFDDWHMGRGGFRLDWDAATTDRLTLQGDIYDGKIGESVGIARYEPPFFEVRQKHADVSGGNLLGRWTHDLSDTSDVTAQMYYDQTFRREANFTEERNTFDLDIQHRFALPWRQEILWGLDYRLSSDTTHAVPTVEFDPAAKTLHLVSGFVQDDVWLLPDRLRLTFGSKFEHNDYSGFEYQPSGSLLWVPAAGHSLWGSISRAVRTPSRLEHDLFLTAAPVNGRRPDFDVCLPAGSPCLYPRIARNRNFKSESILAYQLGYRVQPIDQLFLDLTTFYNEFHHLLSLEPKDTFAENTPPLPHLVLPLKFDNRLHGDSYGVELAATSILTRWWRLSASYSYLLIQLHADAGSGDTSQAAAEKASPQNQVTARSSIDAPWRVQFDTVFRYVDSIRVSGQRIPSYVTFDVRLAKKITDHLEIAAVGQNLWQPYHREFTPGTEVPRGGYGQVRWEW